MSDAAKVLNLAAQLVGQGWTQRAFTRDAEGRSGFASKFVEPACSWCVAGAIDDASARLFGLGWHTPRITAFAAANRAMQDWPGEFRNLAAWNDAHERTQADVVRLLGIAAGIAQAGES